MGKVRAEQASQKLLATGANALISWGFAGALAERIKAGDLLLPSNIINRKGHCFPIDPAWCQRLQRQLSPYLNIHNGGLVSSDSVIADDEQRRQMQRQYDAAAVDMESVAIAACAEQAGVPFVAIRAISDTNGIPIPGTVTRAIDPYGRLHCGGLMRLLAQPQYWPLLWRLSRDARAATITLTKTARLAGPSLCA